MITALHQYITTKYPGKDLLSAVLEVTTSIYQDKFCCFADCGAGVGYSSVRYLDILRSNLRPEHLDKGAVVSYEPLSENIKELERRLNQKNDSRSVVRNVAVSNYSGQAKFTIPNRMRAGSDSWSEGTSAVGYLGSTDNAECIDVTVVRLDDEPYHFNFLKFDLQGGERLALDGLGGRISDAKVLYIEQQLLGGPEAPDFMSLDFLVERGFICFYDEVQFGVNPLISAVPMKLLKDGGVNINNIFMPNGRGLPGIYRGSLSYGMPNSIDQNGRFSDEFIIKLKRAGVPWMATDVLAINKDFFASIASHL